MSANTYGFEFLNFTISDYDTKKVIFEVGRDNPAPQDVSVDFSSIGEDMYRKIKYTFSEDVLRLPKIQTSLIFAVGAREVHKFRMIERHYFRDQLVKSFDFTFGFCIPSSTNTWDVVYSLPPLSDELISDMIAHPWDTKSDTFYFVEDKIIMHNKASYQYFREDAAQAKKSYEDKFGCGSKSSTGSKPVAAAGAGAGAAGVKAVGAGSKPETTGAVPGGAEEKAEAKDADVSARAAAKVTSKQTDHTRFSKEDDYGL